MNIKEAKKEIANTLRAYHLKDQQGEYRIPPARQRPILLMGPPGIGKTAIMEQVTRECGVGLVAYTITHHTRQSAVGLPMIQKRIYQGQERTVTEYTLSEIIASVYECMERTGLQEGILFIDEINCVSETLAPTMLQFLQNKTFGSHQVPGGWVIVAAGNPPQYNKSVREFDIVTLDRVRRIDVEADCGVWMEYAWEQGVHGAVLSYLNIRRDHFYQVEQTGEGKSFVTARGWEDLSQLIASYEELEIPVTRQVIAQYLQKEDVAREFAAYYQLYGKYGRDYGITRILEGNLEDEEYRQRIQMAAAASFEERFTVVGLLLDTLNLREREWEEKSRQVKALHEFLTHLKSYLETREDMQCLRQFLEAQRKSLGEKKRMGLLTRREEKIQRGALVCLEEYDLTLRRGHLKDREQGWERIRELFSRETEKRSRDARKFQKELDRAFAFISAAFGEEQEMILFVSNLTRNQGISSFLGEFGCEPYFRYSKKLLELEDQEELQQMCREISEEE